jgi:hypothetical protein
MSVIAEILLAQVWNNQWILQPLRTVEGNVLHVVYPGVWTHGFGPDFQNAMLEIDGRLVTGDVEVDLESGGWVQHGHDRNDAFDNVSLQVVARHGGAESPRRSNGGRVPTLVLTDFLAGSLEEFSAANDLRPLGTIGFEACAPVVAVEHPAVLQDVWQRAGDQRMQDKVTSISGEMSRSAPAQVLYSRMLDALGFSRNREPMMEIAARLTIDQLVSRLDSSNSRDRFWQAAALLLGIGGFLPLSPRDASIGNLDPEDIGRIETLWSTLGTPWHGIEVSPGFWTLARLRPAAHPVRRLLAAASIIASASSGLVEHLMDRLCRPDPRQQLTAWLAKDNPYLGDAHAHELIVNVMVPFALAYGDEARQPDAIDAAAELWQSLPAGRGNAVTRQTRQQICGEVSIKVGSARAEQGLIHINRQGCSQMRCYECSVAHLALRYEGEIGIESE